MLMDVVLDLDLVFMGEQQQETTLVLHFKFSDISIFSR